MSLNEISKDILFCDGWEFSKNPIGTEYSDSLKWNRVDIPHDWMIYEVRNLYETSTGWYRRKLTYHKVRGLRTSIRFEGVYMDSKTYVNGVPAGEWKYGYSTFEYDITDLLCEGENEITVRVDYRSPNSRWYSGAGIYRRVWLRTYPECHIVSDGVYIHAEADGCVTVSAETARPEGVTVNGLSVRQSVLDGDKCVCSTENPCCAYDERCISGAVRTNGVSYAVNTVTMKIASPVLWDIGSPHLYTMKTELIRDGEPVHTVFNRFGLRKAEFTTDNGFFLNGRHVKLHGCCEHHDMGSLGAAVNKAAIKRKLQKLRVMGVNAVRTSHNMPATEFMELADEMGFLVVSEGFDMWERHKTEYDYAGFFKDWVDKDVASWIRRDRNHPSVIAWSIGNEIYDTHADEHGQEIASMLMGLVREHDPKGNAYVTIGSNYMQWEGAQRCADIVKLAGYNYAERLYAEHHEKHPDWMIYGSETSSTLQSRGIYHFPFSQPVLADDDEQCSSLGNTRPGWAAASTEACIIPDRDTGFCAGQFIWSGFDYIGEPTPYATKNSYFGQIDTAGFPKDSAYIYRAEWTDCKISPFVHIFPYWDFIEGQDIDVRVTSNAPKVALYFNGEKLGEKNIDHMHGHQLTLDANIKYEEGELLAIACDENGNEIARDVQRSFGDAAEIRLIPESSVLKADGRDLIFLEIAAYDANGVHVANANNRVFVKVTGAGRLIGLDNGDSTDYEQYKGTSRRLFSGKLIAVIAAKDVSGNINVQVTSPCLPDSEIILRAEKAEKVCGVSFTEENVHRVADCPDENSDIPVRKISFESDARKFTPDRSEITFKVRVYPANASYVNDIEYRITSVLGIPSKLAEVVSAENGEVKVMCRGDGEFFLRALCKNGTDKYHIISALPLSAEGLGAATVDPYEFVTGGLYTVSSENAGNGIERGAEFAGDGCWFGFENVDFGSTGSDTVTVPIYANCTTPVNIRFWDGVPNEGGEIIGEFTYHETPKWLTYIPNTFKLNKVLKGIHTFVMESSDRYDVKGFVFEKRAKETTEISATDNEGIYGDRFNVMPGEITGIGNNVVLDFGEFDFTGRSPSRIIITGKSKLPLNSIHIIFSGETETRILAEFEGADEYTAREFALEGITGIYRVSFAFLPGSDFDFKSFRFECE